MRCLRIVRKISYCDYLRRTDQESSAAFTSTAAWYEAVLRTTCLPELRSASYKVVVNGRSHHKTVRELGEGLTRGENIYLQYEGGGGSADVHLRETLEIRTVIERDPHWLEGHPITVRDITANEKENHPYFVGEQYVVEDGLHRVPAIMALILSNDYSLPDIPIMYAGAHDHLR